MTIKQQIKHRAVQKIFRLHNGIFHPIPLVTLGQLYSTTPSVLFTKLH